MKQLKKKEKNWLSSKRLSADLTQITKDTPTEYEEERNQQEMEKKENPRKMVEAFCVPAVVAEPSACCWALPSSRESQQPKLVATVSTIKC